MKTKNFLLPALFLIATSTYAIDPRICEIRAALMESVAQERDSGVSKADVMRKAGKKFSSIRPYVDLVYDDMKDLKPQSVGTLFKFTCLKE